MMSDCAQCWNTPCSCGHDGYVTVWPSRPGVMRGGLKMEVMAVIRARLQRVLDEELAQHFPTPPQTKC